MWDRLHPRHVEEFVVFEELVKAGPQIRVGDRDPGAPQRKIAHLDPPERALHIVDRLRAEGARGRHDVVGVGTIGELAALHRLHRLRQDLRIEGNPSFLRLEVREHGDRRHERRGPLGAPARGVVGVVAPAAVRRLVAFELLGELLRRRTPTIPLRRLRQLWERARPRCRLEAVDVSPSIVGVPVGGALQVGVPAEVVEGALHRRGDLGLGARPRLPLIHEGHAAEPGRPHLPRSVGFGIRPELVRRVLRPAPGAVLVLRLEEVGSPALDRLDRDIARGRRGAARLPRRRGGGLEQNPTICGKCHGAPPTGFSWSSRTSRSSRSRT